MSATLGQLKRLEDHLREQVSDLKVAFKDQSWYHKFIGAMVYPFNPRYLTSYTTTIGSTVYFATQEAYEANPESSMITLSHEFVHICDSKKNPFFKLAYMFPQVLALAPIIAFSLVSSGWLTLLLIGGYMAGALLSKKNKFLGLAFIGLSLGLFTVLSVVLFKWLSLILLGILVVAPWPAHWRTYYELRGYGMTLAYREWRKIENPPEYIDSLVKLFVGPPYFYMSWSANDVRRTLEATRQQAEQGALDNVKPYSVVQDFLFHNGLISRNDR